MKDLLKSLLLTLKNIFSYNKTTIEVEAEHVDCRIEKQINRVSNFDYSLRFSL